MGPEEYIDDLAQEAHVRQHELTVIAAVGLADGAQIEWHYDFGQVEANSVSV